MPKQAVRCSAVLLLSGLMLTSGLLIAETKSAEEQVIATAVPENNLSLESLSPGLVGLEPKDVASVIPPALPTPRLSIRRSFWDAAENSLFATTLISFAGMNVADYFLTREALKYPEAGETNPLLRPIVKNAWTFALFKVGYITLNTLGLRSMHETDKPMAWALSLATNLLVALAVTHNISQLDKVKSR